MSSPHYCVEYWCVLRCTFVVAGFSSGWSVAASWSWPWFCVSFSVVVEVLVWTCSIYSVYLGWFRWTRLTKVEICSYSCTLSPPWSVFCHSFQVEEFNIYVSVTSCVGCATADTSSYPAAAALILSAPKHYAWSCSRGLLGSSNRGCAAA